MANLRRITSRTDGERGIPTGPSAQSSFRRCDAHASSAGAQRARMRPARSFWLRCMEAHHRGQLVKAVDILRPGIALIDPVHVVVLAAGRGTRLGTLGDSTPKWLLRVRERTLADRQLEAIALAAEAVAS